MSSVKSLLSKFDSGKLYMVASQVIALGIGYIAQVLLFKFVSKDLIFSEFQLSNFTTNFLGLFVGSVIPVLFSKIVTKNNKDKAKQELKDILPYFIRLITIQSFVSFIIIFGIYLLGGFTLSATLILAVSLLQVFTFSLVNIFHMFYISEKNMGRFFRFYIQYAVIKSLLIIIPGILFQSATAIVLGIFIGGLLHTLSMLMTIKLPSYSKNISLPKIYRTEFIDQLIVNLSLYGILNFSYIAAFFNSSTNYENYNLLALSQPLGLVPYFLISSLGNIYLVDFASGKESSKDFRKIVLKLFFLLIITCIVTIIGSSIFFYLIDSAKYLMLIKYLLYVLPSTVAISLLSIIFSIYQGMGKLRELRPLIILLVPIYFVITILKLSPEDTILLSGGIYLLIVFGIPIISRVKRSHD